MQRGVARLLASTRGQGPSAASRFQDLWFYDNMTGQVLSDDEASAPFSISNGVKQGCMLAPVLFNLLFTCVLNRGP